MVNLKKIKEELESNLCDSNDAIRLIKTVDVNKLNCLGSFANEIRLSISSIIRNISISLWNNYENIKKSKFALEKALKIDNPEEVKIIFRNDLEKLNNIEIEREKMGKAIKSTPTLYTINGIGTTIYSDTLYFVFFAIPIVPLARYNCEPTHGGYRFYGKLELHTWQRIWLSAFTILVAILILSTEN